LLRVKLNPKAGMPGFSLSTTGMEVNNPACVVERFIVKSMIA